MAEYIERGVVLATLSKYGITRNMRAHKAIAQLPIKDVVLVVRCGECKFFGHLIGNSGKYACEKYQLPYCEVDDFCSYGERK